METEIKKTAIITLKVHLDERNMPIKMEWRSDDNP
jgi:hypothetical protein